MLENSPAMLECRRAVGNCLETGQLEEPTYWCNYSTADFTAQHCKTACTYNMLQPLIMYVCLNTLKCIDVSTHSVDYSKLH